MPIQFDPNSVRFDSVGDLYDVALGYQDPATGLTRMVGYCLTPTGQWVEGTNMQDEQHLVQIASPASSDKFTRFPKVSQGDWSGGERQLIYVNPNQYYSSTQLNTALPGHLTCYGAYISVDFTGVNGIGYGSGRVLTSDSGYVYGIPNHTGYVVYDLNLGTVSAVSGTGATALLELTRLIVGIFASGPTGLWTVRGTGSPGQDTNDAFGPVPQSGAVAQFAGGTIYYITSSNTKLNSITTPLGAAPGTTQFTVPVFETFILSLSPGTSGVIMVTGESIIGNTNVPLRNTVYSFDGVNANYLGVINGYIEDSTSVNGVTYILTTAPSFGIGSSQQPVIYEVTGSTLSKVDDYRNVDPFFQSTSTTGTPRGTLDSDGLYLYLFYPGLDAKRYDLTTFAVSDVGTPGVMGRSAPHRGCALIQRGIAEVGAGANTLYVVRPDQPPTADGTMITSWYDQSTPDVDKSFKSIEFSFNSLFTTNSVAVAYQLDNPNTGFVPMAVQVSQSGLQLVGFFPSGTIGKRVRYQITLLHDANPDVQSWSTGMTLARIFTFPISCRRDPKGRNLQDDPQGLTAMQKLATIENAYLLAAGKITLWIPDATASVDNPSIDPITGNEVVGVSQVQAVIQDYQKSTAGGVAPGYRSVDGVFDLEGDVALTIAESLG
jgi:hypothetical protein